MAPNEFVLIEAPVSWDVVRRVAEATFGDMAKGDESDVAPYKRDFLRYASRTRQ
ncbi:MAG: hypothetical protein AB7F75_08790 [Planctomycetota bacterium]